jgi:hypothetical protein
LTLTERLVAFEMAIPTGEAAGADAPLFLHRGVAFTVGIAC